MKLVLIGIPGAGKSTQGNLLSKQLKVPYLSTGHIFREIAKEKTKLGRYIKETMSAGILIPDDKTIQVVNDYLSRPEYQSGYILDGFPRTVRQAEQFKNNVDKVIYLEIPDKEALWRLAHRNEQRNDDTVKAIRKRIDIFHTFTKPVLDFYMKQGKFVVIDGMKKIPEVNEEILKSLGKQLIRNQIKIWERKQKSIIAIVGLPGSGKTESKNFFKKKGVPIVSFSNILNEYIDTNKLSHDEKTHKKLREGWRKKHGMAAFAIMSKKNIETALRDNSIVVIEGMRSWEEYKYLKKEFPKVNVYILVVYADKTLRYKRSEKRLYRRGFYGEERDLNELLNLNMGPTIAFADFLVKNNFSLDEFHDKLEEVYRSVYFAA